MNVFQRIAECVLCKYFNECMAETDDPEEYPDGSCRQIDIFKEREAKDEDYI